MPGRGAQTFKKRQKEQERKEKRLGKIAKRLERKERGPMDPDANPETDGMAEPSADGQTDQPEASPEVPSESQEPRLSV